MRTSSLSAWAGTTKRMSDEAMHLDPSSDVLVTSSTFEICLKAHETRRPGRQKTRHVPLSSWSASVGDVISLDLGRLFECF